MRVVLDTNVLISALVSASGSPAQILALCHAGELELLATTETLSELRRVLIYPRIRKRLQYTDEQIDQYVALIGQNSTILTNVPAVHAVADDSDDNRFVALAVTAGARYLVSGDNHLLQIGHYQGVTILKPADFLALWKTSSLHAGHSVDPE